MTEKTILYVVQEYGVTTEQAVKAIQEYVSKHQPAFEVGEYRAYKDRIYKITEDHDTYICCAELIDGVLVNQSGSYKTGEFYYGSTPATTEQIATFKLAEIKSDIGLIIKNGDGDWIEIVEDIEEYLTEELQEVRE